jgi:hypothetical protein
MPFPMALLLSIRLGGFERMGNSSQKSEKGRPSQGSEFPDTVGSLWVALAFNISALTMK